MRPVSDAMSGRVRKSTAGLGAKRRLRFVSPSRLAVSTKTRPNGSEEARGTRSAGKSWFFETRTMSPAAMSADWTVVVVGATGVPQPGREGRYIW